MGHPPVGHTPPAVSFWQSDLGPAAVRPPLGGPAQVDVCIVGAGYTGLWTAWALQRLAPTWQVMILEARTVGFGASGRNGGWLSGILPGDRRRLADGNGGRDGVIALQHHLQQAVDGVITACAEAGIDADIHKGGSLAVATTPAQMERLRAEADGDRAWGLGPEDLVELSEAQVAERLRVAGARGGLFTPHCARIHPAKLVRGLAAAVESGGAIIHEHSPARSIAAHRVTTAVGDVEARVVIRATEGFSAGLRGSRRTLLPMNSSMVITEPLDAATWAAIGWQGAETLRDGAHVYAYAQRSADGRIALGGRGVPYRFGSRTDDDGRIDPATEQALAATLRRLFPAAAEAEVAQGWCGVLGVARDWCPSVVFDPVSGIGWAGGYVGDGVTTSHLAGLTLADLATGTDSPRSRLPWVGHRSRSWEPEPFRWAGVRGIYRMYRAADEREAAEAGAATSRLARIADVVSGRP